MPAPTADDGKMHFTTTGVPAGVPYCDATRRDVLDAGDGTMHAPYVARGDEETWRDEFPHDVCDECFRFWQNL